MYDKHLFPINFYQWLFLLRNKLEKFDYFDRITFVYNSKVHQLGIKNVGKRSNVGL